MKLYCKYFDEKRCIYSSSPYRKDKPCNLREMDDFAISCLCNSSYHSPICYKFISAKWFVTKFELLVYKKLKEE